MRKLKIAYGNSCFAKKWSNKEITFDELAERLKITVRTAETVEEYPKLPKTERDRVKDKGGFVGGSLKGGLRKGETVECRSVLTLDADHAKAEFADDYEMLAANSTIIYSTHGHTPAAPRLRLIVPLTRDVTPDEYNALARFYAADWGIDQFDECSYRPHQLMYWPSTPSNGEYIFKVINGVWLDPDDVLAKHPNWRDCSQLPTSKRESAVVSREIKRQADPLTKDGIIGAFNTAHFPLQTFIETELGDIYEATTGGRYSYILADSAAGVVLYEDKFCYSNHASDPAYGKLLNAFDLYRVHRYGDKDEKESVKAMLEYAKNDEATRFALAEQRRAKAGDDFSAPLDADIDWTTQLKYQTRSSVLENSVWNEHLILTNDPDFAGFAYNELANQIQITGSVPRERPDSNPFWRDSDTAQLKAVLDIRYVAFSSRNHDVTFTKVADDRRFHPIREFLNALPAWDGVSRVDTLLIRCLQADDTAYVRAVTRKTFAAAVARIYKPGTKFDSVLVFDGVQGIGKSTLFKDLVGEQYYSETLSLTDMDDKSGAEKLQGFWVVEIGELAGMKKADIEKVKAFLSTSDDKYRPSYGKVVESHPRQCIIVGSVNGERGYLRDITGNRRFWIVKVRQEEQVKKWEFTADERDQIWAEAKAIYERGEKLYLEGDLIKSAEDAQKEAMEIDERQGAVEEYLETLLPTNWDTMDVYARRNYISDRDDPTSEKGSVRRVYVSNPEIWCECFGRTLADLKPADSYALAALMTKVDGWERAKSPKRLKLYGVQRVYTRVETAAKSSV